MCINSQYKDMIVMFCEFECYWEYIWKPAVDVKCHIILNKISIFTTLLFPLILHIDSNI